MKALNALVTIEITVILFDKQNCFPQSAALQHRLLIIRLNLKMASRITAPTPTLESTIAISVYIRVHKSLKSDYNNIMSIGIYVHTSNKQDHLLFQILVEAMSSSIRLRQSNPCTTTLDCNISSLAWSR